MIETVVDITTVARSLNIDIPEDESVVARKVHAAEEWIGAFIGRPLADFEELPWPIHEAVTMLTGHLYENREASLVGVSAEMLPFGIYELLAPYREYVF